MREVHTYYSDRYVIAQTGDYAFSYKDESLWWSDDGGETWINEYVWGLTMTTNLNPIPEFDKYVTFAWIFQDGTLLFGTYAELWRSTDKLQTLSQITPTGYTLHTPIAASRPGAYYQPLNYDNLQVMNETEMLVWGNYGNTPKAGAVPTVIWYTRDKGATVKKAFEFGQNPYMSDTGAQSGQHGGNLLGDASESLLTRHIHSCVFDGVDSWYILTGDQSPRDNEAETVEEIHITKLTHNFIADTFSNVVIHSDSNSGETSRYKAAGGNIINGYLYFVSDATSALAGGTEVGVFRCLLADIGDTAKHERLLDFTPDMGGAAYQVIDMKIDPHTGFMIMCIVGGKVAIAWNFGEDGTYRMLNLKHSTDHVKIYPKNANGYFKVDTAYTWEAQTPSLFIKEVREDDGKVIPKNGQGSIVVTDTETDVTVEDKEGNANTVNVQVSVTLGYN